MIAKDVLEAYLYEKKLPSLKDLGLEKHEHLETKIPSFVTLFMGDEVVASTGRVYMKKSSTLEELIDNIVLTTEDPRFQKYISNPQKIRDVKFRVDLLPSEHRTLIKESSEIDIEHHGVIVLAQKQEKLGIILPRMHTEAVNGDALYRHACVKGGIEYKWAKKNDILTYTIRTIIHE